MSSEPEETGEVDVRWLKMTGHRVVSVKIWTVWTGKELQQRGVSEDLAPQQANYSKLSNVKTAVSEPLAS